MRSQSVERDRRKIGSSFHFLDLGVSKAVGGLYWTSWVLLLVILILGTSDVLGRYFLNSPIKGAREISSILVVAIVSFSWAHVQSRRGQITVDFVVSRLPARAKAIAQLVVSLVSMVVFSLIVWQSASIAVRTWQRGYQVPILQVPMGPFHLLVTAGAFLLCLEYVREIALSWSSLKGSKSELH